MLEEMVKGVIEKTLSQQYQHLKLPAILYAKVGTATELEDTYTSNELTVVPLSDSSFRATVTAHWYEYELTIIDRFGSDDSSFPALPGVRSKLHLQPGAIVAVGLCSGDIAPAIIGEVSL